MTEEIRCPNCAGKIKINPDFLPKHNMVFCPHCDYYFSCREIEV